MLNQDMEEMIAAIKETLSLIPEMKADHGVKGNPRDSDPLLFTGVASTSRIEKLGRRVERDFGKPYKAAGEGAFFKNLLDSFVKSVGGIGKEQTLYRRDLSPTVSLFCAFWPWASDPSKTSVRLGLLCRKKGESALMAKALKGCFR